MSLGITLPIGLIVYFVVLSASGFVKKEDFLSFQFKEQLDEDWY